MYQAVNWKLEIFKMNEPQCSVTGPHLWDLCVCWVIQIQAISEHGFRLRTDCQQPKVNDRQSQSQCLDSEQSCHIYNQFSLSKNCSLKKKKILWYYGLVSAYLSLSFSCWWSSTNTRTKKDDILNFVVQHHVITTQLSMQILSCSYDNNVRVKKIPWSPQLGKFWVQNIKEVSCSVLYFLNL